MRRNINKYYIEEFALSNTNNPLTWTEESLLNALKGAKIIGYIFIVKEASSYKLNLYLIRSGAYDSIPLSELQIAWSQFIDNLIHEKSKNKRMVFKNPPLDEWIKTKDNWCKQEANKIMKKFHWEFNEALSQVYWVIVRLYQKKTVYMGNLGYLQTAIMNSILTHHRFMRNKLVLGHENVVSGDQRIDLSTNDDGFVTVFDTIGIEDSYFAEQDYLDFEQEVRELMRDKFSDRELDQIFTQRSGYLPMNLYKRLLKWRAKHNIKEFIG